MLTYLQGYKLLSEEAIFSFLQQVDNNFLPPLSSKVDLAKYATKIFSYAYLIIATTDGTIIGFCAFYDNDIKERLAFLTLIYTDPAFQKKGIASSLIGKMMDVLKEKSFTGVSLEVAKSNTAAIGFYQKLRFDVKKSHGQDLWMKKVL